MLKDQRHFAQRRFKLFSDIHYSLLTIHYSLFTLVSIIPYHPQTITNQITDDRDPRRNNSLPSALSGNTEYLRGTVTGNRLLLHQKQ